MTNLLCFDPSTATPTIWAAVLSRHHHQRQHSSMSRRAFSTTTTASVFEALRERHPTIMRHTPSMVPAQHHTAFRLSAHDPPSTSSLSLGRLRNRGGRKLWVSIIIGRVRVRALSGRKETAERRGRDSDGCRCEGEVDITTSMLIVSGTVKFEWREMIMPACAIMSAMSWYRYF